MACPQRRDGPLQRGRRFLARGQRRGGLSLGLRSQFRWLLKRCRRRLKDRRRGSLDWHVCFGGKRLLDRLHPAEFGGQVEDVLLFLGRRRAATQDTRDVVDDPVVSLPFRGLKTFLVPVARRGGTLPCRTRLVV